MRASGPSGTGLLRVGYQTAMDLGAWEIKITPGFPRYAFHSTILRRHAYWSAQRPMDLALTVGATEWLWRDIAPVVTGDVLQIELHERPIVSDRSTTGAHAT